MKTYGANVAGFFWNAGTVLQFLFGLIVFSPLQIAASAFNIACPLTYLFLGHRNIGAVIGGCLGIVGTILSVYPQIIAGEWESIVGVLAFVFFVSLNIFSLPLTRRYINNKKKILRETWGHPRRLAGWGPLFLTRLPIIYESVTHGRWQLAIIFGVWSLGDLALGFSKAPLKERT
jgi:hypothetical protein